MPGRPVVGRPGAREGGRRRGRGQRRGGGGSWRPRTGRRTAAPGREGFPLGGGERKISGSPAGEGKKEWGKRSPRGRSRADKMAKRLLGAYRDSAFLSSPSRPLPPGSAPGVPGGAGCPPPPTPVATGTHNTRPVAPSSRPPARPPSPLWFGPSASSLLPLHGFRSALTAKYKRTVSVLTLHPIGMRPGSGSRRPPRGALPRSGLRSA